MRSTSIEKKNRSKRRWSFAAEMLKGRRTDAFHVVGRINYWNQGKAMSVHCFTGRPRILRIRAACLWVRINTDHRDVRGTNRETHS